MTRARKLRGPRRSRAVQRELDFDHRVRWLQDGRDPLVEQIFLEFKLIDAKAQGLLTFVGLLLVALVAGSGTVYSHLAFLFYIATCGLSALSALYALSTINLLGGHSRFIRHLFDADLNDAERLEWAQTLFARIAVGRRQRYLMGYWLALFAVVFAVFAFLAQQYPIFAQMAEAKS